MNLEKTTHDSLLSSIRKEFFSLRNGMIADTLRKGGLEQKYIFGLQLPQIKGMAERYRTMPEEEMAKLSRALWSDRDCREARLLACHLMPPALMTKEEAMDWAGDIISREEADILAFKLIRHLPYGDEMAKTFSNSDSQLKKYTAIAIQRFL